MKYAITRLETTDEFADIPAAVVIPFDAALVEQLRGLCSKLRDIPNVYALSIFNYDLLFIKTLPEDIEELLDESDYNQVVVERDGWDDVDTSRVVAPVTVISLKSDDFIVEAYDRESYAEVYTSSVGIDWLAENL